MTRDPGLEELLREEVGDRPGLSEKSMFCFAARAATAC